MEQSTYYGLNLVTGSDLVNPLIQDKPNYETIDLQMHNNALAGIATATELKTGTVHALVRSNTDIDVFRYVATADYATGDTFTVDGSAVTAYLPNGNPLPDKAYVTNSNVFCILDENRLTVYSSKDYDDAISDIDERVTNNTNAIVLHQNQVGNVTQLETDSKIVVGAVNELKSDLGELITTKSFTTSTSTVQANSDFSFTTNIALEGYTPVGVILYTIAGTHNDYCIIYAMSINNNSLVTYLRNSFNGSFDVHCIFTVLYVKNS